MNTLNKNIVEDERQTLLKGIQIPTPEEVYFNPPTGNPERAIALLASWCEDDDEAEQRETIEYLMRVLDEDRLSYRKLFP
jgi:hypothetical protein